ncbi:hypothetical protein CVT25_002997 [Psilocybe cyanescens]|uniref:Uncharacterized protein n=1 Tax=Psilocybe cyanescens TaxID=93625 RepID=A0A409WN42_PSICY|nr:hypothetical protein CVT25_002997 [Psilocybe cyanescens]
MQGHYDWMKDALGFRPNLNDGLTQPSNWQSFCTRLLPTIQFGKLLSAFSKAIKLYPKYIILKFFSSSFKAVLNAIISPGF